MCHQTQIVYNDLIQRSSCRMQFSKSWSINFSANRSNPYKSVLTLTDMNKPMRRITFLHAIGE